MKRSPGRQRADEAKQRRVIERAAAKERKKERPSKAVDAVSRVESIRQSYNGIMDRRCEVPPSGFSSLDMSATHSELLENAIMEVQHIFSLIESRLSGDLQELYPDADLLSNLRFAVNTPYFSRNSSDPWPLMQWDDPRLCSLTQLLTETVVAFGDTCDDLPSPALNVMVRKYRAGDALGFHSDREDFTENIYGMVLANTDPERGLLLCDRRPPDGTGGDCNVFGLREHPGFTWRLEGEARHKWKHGYAAPLSSTADSESACRISISFRFFRDLSVIPQYNPVNDV